MCIRDRLRAEIGGGIDDRNAKLTIVSLDGFEHGGLKQVPEGLSQHPQLARAARESFDHLLLYLHSV